MPLGKLKSSTRLAMHLIIKVKEEKCISKFERHVSETYPALTKQLLKRNSSNHYSFYLANEKVGRSLIHLVDVY